MSNWAYRRELEWNYKQLFHQLRYHKFRYYVMDDPILSDSQYDHLEREFVSACERLKLFPAMYKVFGEPKLWVDSTDYEGMPRLQFPWKVKGE